MKKGLFLYLTALLILLFAAGCGKEEMVEAAAVDHTDHHAMSGAAVAMNYDLATANDARAVSVATTKANMSLIAVLHPVPTSTPWEPTPIPEPGINFDNNSKKETEPSAAPSSAPSYTTYSADLTDEEREAVAEVIKLTNQERSSAGRSALKEDATLTALAMKRAEEASRNWGHTRPNGKSWDSILYGTAFYNTYAGENLVMGTGFTPSNALSNWMNSEGHKANILNSKYNCIGVGVYRSGDNVYYVQIFSRS